MAAFATSYIKTTSASVTRNADAASMTGVNFSSWYRADEGTLYAETLLTRAPSSLNNILTVSDNTSINFIDLRYRSVGTVGAQVGTNSVTQVNNTTGLSPSANQPVKDAFAFATNNTAESINGASVISDTSVILPVVSRFYIGASQDGLSAYLNGTIKKIAYYPKRLTNAELQGLTTV